MDMTSVSSSRNALSAMLGVAFNKMDRNKDGALDADEFGSFNEVLKPGIATDENGRPSVDYFSRMDQDADGEVTQQEMHSTGVLMPASLTDPTLGKMWDYLSRKGDAAAQAAADLIRDDGTAEA
jgi:Ca2+-binding EF-hand superfamily protein